MWKPWHWEEVSRDRRRQEGGLEELRLGMSGERSVYGLYIKPESTLDRNSNQI